jgi:hypothetical protein
MTALTKGSGGTGREFHAGQGIAMMANSDYGIPGGRGIHEERGEGIQLKYKPDARPAVQLECSQS